jgi:O-acetylhomoserine/O-acetylserine sulfhydrylase-like pyridoxal-dependent enzyme
MAAMSVSKFDFEVANAGQTISSDWAASSRKITELFAKTRQAVSSVVVYGGTEKQVRNDVTYLPWHAIQDYSWVE